jgi:predicted ATPase
MAIDDSNLMYQMVQTLSTDKVTAMPETQPHEEDPGASTAMFRAFVDEAPSEPAHTQKLSTRTLAILAAAIAVIAVVAAIAIY